jgi:hypothetical protein
LAWHLFATTVVRAEQGRSPVTDMDHYRTRVLRLIAEQPIEAGHGIGVLGVLQRLCGAVARTLSASGAGMSVMGDNGVRAVTAANDPASTHIEELQFVLGEGPGVDAFTAARPVLVPDLADGARSRWPAYVPALQEHGVGAMFAFPLQIGAARIGVLDVFRVEPGHLRPEELGHALTFADVAVTTLLDGQANATTDAPPDGLVDAIDGRAELFQAQGMVMVQLGLGLAEALARIRAYAYAENRHLSEVASDIVLRKLQLDPDHEQPAP